MMTQEAISRKREIVETLTDYGYRVAWVNPDSTIAHGFKDGQTYPYEAYAEEYEKAGSLALILDDKLLVDFDLNHWIEDNDDGKPLGDRPSLDKLAAAFGLADMPHPVQSNDEGTSLHFLFSIPEGGPPIKCSNDGKWMPYVDLKSGNQVMHIKLTKEMDLNDLAPDALTVATEPMLDVLRAKDVDTSSPAPKWEGDAASLEEARAILRAVEVPPDYGNWMTVLFGIHSNFGATAEGLALADDWSAKGEKYLGTKHIRYKLSTMGSYSGKEIGFGTVCKLAERNGYDLSDSWKRRQDNVSPIREGIRVEDPQTISATLEPVWEEPVNWWEDITYPAYPIASLPAIIQERARAISETTGQDVAGHATTHLSAACSAINCNVQICLSRKSAWRARPILWDLKVGGSGSGKSVTDRLAFDPLRTIQGALIEQYEKELETYEAELEQYTEAKKKKQVGTLTKPVKPRRVDFLTDEATIEALREMLVDSNRGATATIDELDTWYGGQGQYKKGGKDADKAHWLKGFDGGEHKIDRVGRMVNVKNWSTGLVANTTPAGLARISDKLMVSDGTIQRFLITKIKPSQAASDEGAGLTPELQQRWSDLLQELYSIEPCIVYMTKEAERVFLEHRNRCQELAQALDASNEGLGSFVSKQPDKTGRVALVLHCIRHGRQAAAHQVCLDDLRSAIGYTNGLHHHAASMFDQASGGGQFDMVKGIATGIVGSKLSGHVTWSELRECYKPADRIIRRGVDKRPVWEAIRLLMDTGWIRCTSNGGEFLPNGKQNTFEVNSAVHVLYREHGERQRKLRKLIRESIQETAELSRFTEASAEPDVAVSNDEDDFLSCISEPQLIEKPDDDCPF